MGCPKPVYLLAGGKQSRKSTDSLIQEMLRAFGVARPAVAYMGAASGDDLQFLGFIEPLLRQAGAGRVELVALAEPGCNLKVARSCLKSADVIFFSGGDVELGMQLLLERHVIGLIRDRYQAGVVFAGLSAGSILLGPQWVRWRDPDDDSTAEPFECLGLVPVVCDMHDEAGGWAELKTMLCLRGINGEIGYGVPSGSGLCIHPDGSIKPMGGKVERFRFRDGRVEEWGRKDWE